MGSLLLTVGIVAGGVCVLCLVEAALTPRSAWSAIGERRWPWLLGFVTAVGSLALIIPPVGMAGLYLLSLRPQLHGADRANRARGGRIADAPMR